MENNTFIYTEEQLMARLKFFIGVCLALTLTGIVFVVLYSIIFVTQPLNAISPIDQKFFELIIPIATFLTGTLSGIMLAGVKKEDQEAMLAANKQAQENFAETKKAMTAPPKREPNLVPLKEPAFDFSLPGVPMGGGNAPAPAQELTPLIINGFGGKPAPLQPPQPLL